MSISIDAGETTFNIQAGAVIDEAFAKEFKDVDIEFNVKSFLDEADEVLSVLIALPSLNAMYTLKCGVADDKDYAKLGRTFGFSGYIKSKFKIAWAHFESNFEKDILHFADDGVFVVDDSDANNLPLAEVVHRVRNAVIEDYNKFADAKLLKHTLGINK